MNKKCIFLKIFCGITALLMLGITVGCNGDNNTQSNQSVPSDTESVVSELLPIKATFDEKYTKLLPTSEGEEINAKGNVGVEVKSTSTTQYDPYSFEALNFEQTYTLSNGLGVGSSCAEFMEFYGIKRGYYLSYDENRQAVDVEIESGKPFSVVAILMFDEDTNKTTYVPGGKVGEHFEALYSAGQEYMENAGIGKDVLVVKLSVKPNLTVESFELVHYLI